jgi:hypothetical protein
LGAGLDRFRHPLQHRIAGAVAEVVVDGLEMIKIAEQHGEAFPACGTPSSRA